MIERVSREAYAGLLERMRVRKADYQLCFGSPAGQKVLEDLSPFCRERETCVVAGRGQHVDRERTLILEGRRECILRIRDHLDLTPEELYAVYDGRPIEGDD